MGNTPAAAEWEGRDEQPKLRPTQRAMRRYHCRNKLQDEYPVISSMLDDTRSLIACRVRLRGSWRSHSTFYVGDTDLMEALGTVDR